MYRLFCEPIEKKCTVVSRKRFGCALWGIHLLKVASQTCLDGEKENAYNVGPGTFNLPPTKIPRGLFIYLRKRNDRLTFWFP